MKVIFSPDLSNYKFLGMPKDKSVAMDFISADLNGLVGLLELHAGIYIEQKSQNLRIAEYYSVLNEVIKSGKGEILKESFRNDGYGCSASMLQWRDKLVMCGFNCTTSIPKDGRLEVLREVEKSFKSPGISDRLINIINKVQRGCQLPDDLQIYTLIKKDVMHPSVLKLLNALESRGVKIEAIKTAKQSGNLKMLSEFFGNNAQLRTLNNNDDSIRTYNFPTKNDAYDYILLSGDPRMNSDVIIDSDDKCFDNKQKMLGLPLSGSSINEGASQITQLFITGICLFQRPLNISVLIDWLRLPVSPLSRNFATILADTIISSGGFKNKECQEVIKKYIDGDYEHFEEGLSEDEKNEKKKHSRRHRLSIVKNFLPPTEDIDSVAGTEKISVGSILKFIDSMSTWAKNRRNHGNDGENVIKQLSKVIDMNDALQLMLASSGEKEFSFESLHILASSMIETSENIQYKAQCGCRDIVSSTQNILCISRNTVWADFVGKETGDTSYSFLSPKERKLLPLDLWSAESERQYQFELMMIPFRHTSERLTLITYNRDEYGQTSKHPLLIMLESEIKRILGEDASEKELSKITVSPHIADSYYKKVEPVNNAIDNPTGFTINNGSLIQWRQKESPTRLEDLINYPMDYIFDIIAKIRNKGLSELKDIDRTQGEVAHAVIADLFSPFDSETLNDYYTRLSQKITENFDKAFLKAVNERGAILLQQENIIPARQMKDSLRNAVSILYTIIKENSLKVESCEKTYGGAILDNEHDVSIDGRIDMVLTDISGKHVIFDFKWTTSKKKHESLLAKNRSVQLACYSEMIDNTKATAYFIMPANILISCYNFKGGDYIRLVKPESMASKNVFNMTKNSYKYRREQITEGFVETGEEVQLDDLRYVQDTDEYGLLPVSSYDGKTKDRNLYSNYNLFKRVRQ